MLFQEIIYLKNGFYVINLDKYKLIGAHWITLYVNGDNVTYFKNFGVEHIPKEIKKFMENKSITSNIQRIQVYNSIMWEYFCFGFINFIPKRKKVCQILPIYFLPTNMKKMIK